jgi:hypothetical protein
VGTKILVFLVVAVMGGSIVYGFVRPDRTVPAGRRPPATTQPEPRIAFDARERYAGSGIWSAWRPYPPRAGTQTTVLWRTAGFSPRSVVLAGESSRGRALLVAFAPTRVIPPLAGAGFGWHRAGVEWGSKVVFPTAGSWTVRVVAGSHRGRVTLRVVE